MNAFYERHRDDRDDFDLHLDRVLIYPPHFHESVEIAIVKKGIYGVTLNGESYDVGENSVFFSDSYDVHSYESFVGSGDENCLLLIPAKYLSGFREIKAGRRVTEPVIRDEKLCDEIIGIAKNLFLSHLDDDAVLKAGTNLIFTILAPRLGLSDRTKEDCSLIRKLLVYAQDNFKGDASIADFSAKSGYSKEHLSRTFHKFIKRSFPDYVNSLRLDYVENRLKAGDDVKVTVLLFDAGFGSIQSYYRAKTKRHRP